MIAEQTSPVPAIVDPMPPQQLPRRPEPLMSPDAYRGFIGCDRGVMFDNVPVF
ncbi:MAG: hypothetical protein JWM59_1419 [Verrucomicrobiales bacterium]|nr:hypothetical protein [Verrucomicrobiales bacterium]